MSDDILVLMARGAEQMNVPLDKVQKYLDEGWKEISRAPMATSAPVSAETPAAPLPKAKLPKGSG